eukprot:gene17457-20830_t
MGRFVSVRSIINLFKHFDQPPFGQKVELITFLGEGGKMTVVQFPVRFGDIDSSTTGGIICGARGRLGGDNVSENIRKYNENTLIHLSATKLNLVATGLSEILESLLKRKDKDETNEHNNWAQLYIFDLFAKYEQEAIRLKEMEEQILPPPLEESLARMILSQTMSSLMRGIVNGEVDTQRMTGSAIFQLSATNYEAVSTKVSEILHTAINSKEADESFTNQFHLIEHLNLNSKRLAELLDRIGKVLPSLKKERHQLILAQVLKRAVWNWIDNYPMEFVTLCKMCERFPGNPDVLFDIFDGWAKKTAHRVVIWPLQTMLLILCPDIMLKINQGSHDKSIDSKRSFTDTLRKSLKVPKLADVAAVCYVDFCKASTFVSKSELSALRYFVPQIETELKERLFNNQKVAEENELELMIDFLVASFKVSPRKLPLLIPDCLNPESPPHLKMVLVKSLLRIAQDTNNSLPWSPTIADARPLISLQLKTLFHDCLQSVRSHSSLKNATDKKSKAQFEKVAHDVHVMSYLIQLFLADPKLALHPIKTPAQDLEDIRNIITGLCFCSSQFALPDIAVVASEALLKFHDPVHIESWYEKKMINGFWEISSAVNVSLANALLEQKDSRAEHIQRLVTLLEEILIRRNAFLEKSKETLRPEAAVREVRMQGSTKLEVSLLVYLASTEPDICTKCATCFGLLCEEIEILSDHTDDSNSIMTNYPIYKKLSTAGVLLTGRQHQQKGIRTLLRRIEAQTTGNFAAWEEVYTRWCALTPLLVTNDETDKNKSKVNSVAFKSPTPALDGRDVRQEWYNTLGFLCSLSGVTLNKLTVKVADKIRNLKSKGLQERTVKVIDSFMDEIMDLIVSDTPFIREASMSLTGTALSPSAYAVLFRHLQAELHSFFGEAGQLEVTDRSTLFVDQTISIVKHILEISQEADDLSIITSFEGLILLTIKYLNHLVPSTTCLRIKKNFCSLLDVMMIKRQYISFSKEVEFRNTLIENIIEWTSDFNQVTKQTLSAPTEMVRVEAPTDPNSKNEAILMKKLSKEVDVACVTTIASLLRGLELTTGDRANNFGKYFTFFTTLLTRCEQDSDCPPQLADGAIRSLSNMLSANVHYDYFIKMGYHEDHETRAAFLRVIANILNQGTGFGVAEDESEKYEKFVELLLEPEYYAVIALGEATQITEADEVAKLLVNFFDVNDRAIAILKKVIHQEVSSTDTANTLLRRNSVATKMLAAYTKLIGGPYLRAALYSVIKNLLDDPQQAMEIDPQRLAPGEDVAANTARLLALTSNFIKAIQKSTPLLPAPLREICAYIAKVVAETFPGNEKMAIGGVMFLRFICPAIISPEIFGIVSAGALSKEARRCLVLCTKVLQNLANGQMGVRETYMASCNAFVNENARTIDDLFDSFTVISPDAPPAKAPVPTDDARDEDIIALHRHFATGLDRISPLLSEMGQKVVAERLTQILQRLGAPPDIDRKKAGAARAHHIAPASKATSNFYEDFMRRFRDLNTDVLKQKKIFYKQGLTRDKLPVFYYIARRYEATMDMEHLLFHILKTIQDSIRAPFVLVIDCTLFEPDHGIPLAWATTWLRHFPDAAGEHVRSIIVVNANHAFKKYTKRVGKLVGRAAKKVVLLASATRIFEHILEADHGLPASSLAVETDVKSTFSPVVKLSGQYSEKNVTLRISTDLIQMLSIKLHPILGKQVALVDLYHISQILSVGRGSADDDEEFVIRYDHSLPKSMTFKSPACMQILQAATQALARWKLSRPPDTTIAKDVRVFRPQDIPGTLLNVALLNLGSSKNSLRVAAYNMLSALCRNANFSINLMLLETNGLCIPKNISQFVIRVSAALARTEPGLTLEFLTECLHGFGKASVTTKSLVLDYVSPWLPNLALFCTHSDVADCAEKFTKTLAVVNHLIDLSIGHSNIKATILSKVWEKFGEQRADLVNLALKCCLKRALDGGFGSNQAETVAEMVSIMASQSPQLVAGKLIAKVLRLLERTTEAPIVVELAEHKLWSQIVVYLRILLTISFDNLICAQQFLPELLHIICSTFSIGNTHVRITVHGLLINTVHSLYTSLVSPDNKLPGLPFLLSEFGSPSFRLLFGIGGSTTTDFTITDPSARDLERMSIMNVDPVVSNIFSMLNTCSPGGQCFGTAWHARWLSFTTIAALRHNPPIQCRALITLGIIARSSTFVRDELVENIIKVLRGFVTAPRALVENNDLIVGVLSCLTKLFEYIPPTSRFITPLFWVAATMVQLYEPRIFTATVALLEVMIKSMDRWDLFQDSVARTLMTAREPYNSILSRLDNTTGISFESNFSFAIASHLLKGIKHPSTKTMTARLINTFLTITAKRGNGISVLGYLSALFPTEGEVANTEQISILSGEASRTTPMQLLFNDHMLPDNDNAALLFTYLVTLLSHTDREHEQLFIYDALKEGITFAPKAFPVISKSFIPKISNIIATSQIERMTQSCLAIMEQMFNFKVETDITNCVGPSHLKKLCFQGLPDCGAGFARQSTTINETIIRACGDLLTSISQK